MTEYPNNRKDRVECRKQKKTDSGNLRIAVSSRSQMQSVQLPITGRVVSRKKRAAREEDGNWRNERTCV